MVAALTRCVYATGCGSYGTQRRQTSRVERLLHAQAGFASHRVGEVARDHNVSIGTVRERHHGMQMQLEHRFYPRVHAAVSPTMRSADKLKASSSIRRGTRTLKP